MVLVASVVLANAYSSWSTSYPDDHGSQGEAWTMPSSGVSVRMLLEEFPVQCARVVRTWNLVHYFPLSLHLAVTVLGVWGLFLGAKWEFTGDDYFRECNTWFDS